MTQSGLWSSNLTDTNSYFTYVKNLKIISENQPQIFKRVLKLKGKNTIFFLSNTFISNARLKLAKNQANAKEQP